MRADAIAEAGGFRGDPLDTVLALRKQPRAASRPRTVALIPNPISYGPSPRSFRELHDAVSRDQRALAHAVRAEGMGGTSWFLPALVGWRFLLPLVETGAYLLLIAAVVTGHASGTLIELVLLAALGSGALVSMAAVVLRELARYEAADLTELARLFAAAMIESLGYRQVRNLWLIAGFFRG